MELSSVALCWSVPPHEPFPPEHHDKAEFWHAMGRHSTGGMYLNFPGFGEEKEALVRAGYGANYDRLAELKAKYDPENLFRMNLNITPAA